MGVFIEEVPIYYYVGDPCYVIDDNRWDEFCNQLFSKDSRGYPVDIKWELDGDTYDIEVWNSPGGDGVWGFSQSDSLGNSVSLGVDAGLLAVVPVECCEKREIGSSCGAWFSHRPDLETDDGPFMGGYVLLNGEKDDGWTQCWECGEEQRHDFDYCDNCGLEVD